MWEQTEAAYRLFLERVRQIAGVVRVEPGDTPVATIRVVVPERLGETGQQVYDLEDELRREYPEARLDVWVSEAR
jgi:hypothetical protein